MSPRIIKCITNKRKEAHMYSMPKHDLLQSFDWNKHFTHKETQLLIVKTLQASQTIFRSDAYKTEATAIGNLLNSPHSSHESNELFNQIIHKAVKEISPLVEKPALLLRKGVEQIVISEINLLRDYYLCNSLDKVIRFISIASFKSILEAVQIKLNQKLPSQREFNMGIN